MRAIRDPSRSARLFPDLLAPSRTALIRDFLNTFAMKACAGLYGSYNNKQLLDEVFVISGIIKVSVSVTSRSRRLRLITLISTLIIPHITKTESNNCFIIHCFEENNNKRIIAAITVFQTLKNVQLSDKQIFTVFIKQSSAEKLNAFLKKVSLKKTVDD